MACGSRKRKRWSAVTNDARPHECHATNHQQPTKTYMHNHPRSANPVPALFNTPPIPPASFDHSTLLSILAGDSTAVDRKRSATSCSRPPRQLLPSALTHFRVRIFSRWPAHPSQPLLVWLPRKQQLRGRPRLLAAAGPSRYDLSRSCACLHPQASCACGQNQQSSAASNGPRM